MANGNDLYALEQLRAAVSPASTAGLLRERGAASAAAAGGMLPETVPGAATGVVPGAPMVRGRASPLELAIRGRMKATQDAQLRRLLAAQRGQQAAAAAPQPVFEQNPADLLR